MPFIELEGVTKTVTLPGEPDLRILTGMDLRVEVGEHVSTVSHSSTGKSTMPDIVEMLDLPTAGRYMVDGIDVASLGKGRWARLRGDTVGFIFQQFNIFNACTALKSVEVPLPCFNGARFWKRRKLTTRMLEYVDLNGRMGSHPIRMSGGEQQRTTIAHALMRSSKIILTDEPTGVPDPDTGGNIMELLETVAAENNAVLLVTTHNPKVAKRADRVLELYDGALHEGRVSLFSSESREVKAWYRLSRFLVQSSRHRGE